MAKPQTARTKNQPVHLSLKLKPNETLEASVLEDRREPHYLVRLATSLSIIQGSATPLTVGVSVAQMDDEGKLSLEIVRESDEPNLKITASGSGTFQAREDGIAIVSCSNETVRWPVNRLVNMDAIRSYINDCLRTVVIGNEGYYDALPFRSPDELAQLQNDTREILVKRYIEFVQHLSLSYGFLHWKNIDVMFETAPLPIFRDEPSKEEFDRLISVLHDYMDSKLFQIASYFANSGAIIIIRYTPGRICFTRRHGRLNNQDLIEVEEFTRQNLKLRIGKRSGGGTFELSNGMISQDDVSYDFA